MGNSLQVNGVRLILLVEGGGVINCGLRAIGINYVQGNGTLGTGSLNGQTILSNGDLRSSSLGLFPGYLTLAIEVSITLGGGNGLNLIGAIVGQTNAFAGSGSNLAGIADDLNGNASLLAIIGSGYDTGSLIVLVTLGNAEGDRTSELLGGGLGPCLGVGLVQVTSFSASLSL